MLLLDKYILALESIDEDQIECYQLSGAILSRRLGPYQAGTKLPCIAFDFVYGKVSVYATETSAKAGIADWEGDFSITIG